MQANRGLCPQGVGHLDDGMQANRGFCPQGVGHIDDGMQAIRGLCPQGVGLLLVRASMKNAVKRVATGKVMGTHDEAHAAQAHDRGTARTIQNVLQPIVEAMHAP